MIVRVLEFPKFQILKLNLQKSQVYHLTTCFSQLVLATRITLVFSSNYFQILGRQLM